MNKLLIISDKTLDLSLIDENYDFINLRHEFDGEDLMAVYSENPERASALRKEIEGLEPTRILVIGEMGEYIWLATVLSSLFGKFNAWLGQYDQEHASTKVMVAGKETPMLALKRLDDLKVYKEWSKV